jgi:hypothetical protein
LSKRIASRFDLDFAEPSLVLPEELLSLTLADNRGKIELMQRRIAEFLGVVTAVALVVGAAPSVGRRHLLGGEPNHRFDDGLIAREFGRSEWREVVAVMEELGR